MGRLFKQQYVRKGGKRGESRKWYCKIRDGEGKWRAVPLSTDKQVARAMHGDLIRETERKRAGLVDEFAASRQVPIAGVVAKYLKDLTLKGDGERHVADTTRLLDRVIRECRFDTLGGMNASALDDFLVALVKPNGMPCSARTKTTYRQAAMGFANWCVRKGKLEYNPLTRSTKPRGEVRVERRALMPDQLRQLLEVAGQRPLREKLTIRSGPNRGRLDAQVRPHVRARLEQEGRQRVLLYKAAVYTGLRRGELKALRVDHLTLEGTTPSLNMPAEFTKNRKQASLPLRLDFAAELRKWIQESGRTDVDLVFGVGRDVAKHLKRDMKAAGIPVVDQQGRVFDFHALRKCSATYMNRAGVPLTTVKEMMRHSTVESTAGVYNDGDLHDLRLAVSMLPQL